MAKKKKTPEQIQSVPGDVAPLVEENIQGRYAGLLFKIASMNKALYNVNEDMTYLQEILDQSESLQNFVMNSSTKRNEFNLVFTEIYPQLNETTVKFLDTLIDNKRMDSLPKIISTYLGYYKLLNKEESVTIISANELSDERKSRLVDTLSKSKADTKFTIKYEVNPDILGGLQIYMGNKF